MRMILLKFNVQFGVLDQFRFWDSISLIKCLEQSKVFFVKLRVISHAQRQTLKLRDDSEIGAGNGLARY